MLTCVPPLTLEKQELTTAVTPSYHILVPACVQMSAPFGMGAEEKGRNHNGVVVVMLQLVGRHGRHPP